MRERDITARIDRIGLFAALPDLQMQVVAGRVAGGGVFVHYDKISEKSAEVYVDTEVRNDGSGMRNVSVETALTDAGGKLIKQISGSVTLKAGETRTVKQKLVVNKPQLWSPDSPYLYRVESRVKEKGKYISFSFRQL